MMWNGIQCYDIICLFKTSKTGLTVEMKPGNKWEMSKTARVVSSSLKPNLIYNCFIVRHQLHLLGLKI